MFIYPVLLESIHTNCVNNFSYVMSWNSLLLYFTLSPPSTETIFLLSNGVAFCLLLPQSTIIGRPVLPRKILSPAPTPPFLTSVARDLFYRSVASICRKEVRKECNCTRGVTTTGVDHEMKTRWALSRSIDYVIFRRFSPHDFQMMFRTFSKQVRVMH